MNFRVDLPVPPSTNALYIMKNNRRIKSPEYRSWKQAAALSIVAQVRADQRVGGPVDVEIKLPSFCRLDIDNAIKPLLDALVASGRIDDDRNVAAVSIRRDDVTVASVAVRAA